uniref:Uncharacterized protein n=1 Tax=Anopheles farauti TaxID=69004 RepID=A0A182QHJ6_9DIPT
MHLLFRLTMDIRFPLLLTLIAMIGHCCQLAIIDGFRSGTLSNPSERDRSILHLKQVVQVVLGVGALDAQFRAAGGWNNGSDRDLPQALTARFDSTRLDSTGDGGDRDDGAITHADSTVEKALPSSAQLAVSNRLMTIDSAYGSQRWEVVVAIFAQSVRKVGNAWNVVGGDGWRTLLRCI